jgi:signal transduction protein with GAF and PtsI domain
MASQQLTAFALIGLGVRQLSVAPRAVRLVKRLVRAITVATATVAAREALEARTAEAAHDLLSRYLALACGADPLLADGLPEPF